ncbi:MAG: hypothetical protein QXI16_01285 [Sulfolobaceae archaeon]
MNKLKWIILPVLMIVSFVLITKPTYAMPGIENYEYLVESAIFYDFDKEYYELNVYNPIQDDFTSFSQLAFQIPAGPTYLINVQNVLVSQMLLHDINSNRYVFDTPIYFYDYISFWKTYEDDVQLLHVRFLKVDGLNVDIIRSYEIDMDEQVYGGSPKIIVLQRNDATIFVDGVPMGINEYGQHMYDKGLEYGSAVLDNTFTLFEAVLSSISNVFKIMIFPGVTIGILFMIPISFAMFKWFLKLIK